MSNDILRISSKASLSGLRPLLEAWGHVVLDYCKTHRYWDNPWWYTERANVGTLAGAAWRCRGWTALEEFGTRKRKGIIARESNKDDTNNGRIDLWISHGSRSFVVEAKQAWQSIGRRASGKNPQIRDEFLAAWKDIGNVENYEADLRIAATFVVPFIPTSQLTVGETKRTEEKRNQEVSGYVHEWLSSCWPFHAYNAHAAAAVFPFRSSRMIGKSGSNLFPGVVLLLRQRHKASAPSKE